MSTDLAQLDLSGANLDPAMTLGFDPAAMTVDGAPVWDAFTASAESVPIADAGAGLPTGDLSTLPADQVQALVAGGTLSGVSPDQAAQLLRNPNFDPSALSASDAGAFLASLGVTQPLGGLSPQDTLAVLTGTGGAMTDPAATSALNNLVVDQTGALVDQTTGETVLDPQDVAGAATAIASYQEQAARGGTPDPSILDQIGKFIASISKATGINAGAVLGTLGLGAIGMGISRALVGGGTTARLSPAAQQPYPVAPGYGQLNAAFNAPGSPLAAGTIGAATGAATGQERLTSLINNQIDALLKAQPDETDAQAQIRMQSLRNLLGLVTPAGTPAAPVPSPTVGQPLPWNPTGPAWTGGPVTAPNGQSFSVQNGQIVTSGAPSLTSATAGPGGGPAPDTLTSGLTTMATNITNANPTLGTDPVSQALYNRLLGVATTGQTDPLLEYQFQQEREQLGNKMQAMYGPQWMATSPGIEALQALQTSQEGRRYELGLKALATLQPAYQSQANLPVNQLSSLVPMTTSRETAAQQIQNQRISNATNLSGLGQTSFANLGNPLATITPIPTLTGMGSNAPNQAVAASNAANTNLQIASLNAQNQANQGLVTGIGSLIGTAIGAGTPRSLTFATNPTLAGQ